MRVSNMTPASGVEMCALCLRAVLRGVTIKVTLLPQAVESGAVPPEGWSIVDDNTGEQWVFLPGVPFVRHNIDPPDWYLLVFWLHSNCQFELGDVKVFPLVTTMYKGTRMCPTHLKVEADIEYLHEAVQ